MHSGLIDSSSTSLHINPNQTLKVAQYVANSLPVLCLVSAFFFPGALTTLALSAIRFTYLFFLALRTPIIKTQQKMAQSGQMINHCHNRPLSLLHYLLQALSYFINEVFSAPLALCTTLLSVFYIQINTLNQVLSAFSIGMFSNILNSVVEIGLFTLLTASRYYDRKNQASDHNSLSPEETAITKRENELAFVGGSLLMLWLVHDELSLLTPSLAPALMIFALPEVEVLLALYYTWNMLQWASIHCISPQLGTEPRAANPALFPIKASVLEHTVTELKKLNLDELDKQKLQEILEEASLPCQSQK